MPAGIGDNPLQKRAGKNTSPGPVVLFEGVKGAGEIVPIKSGGQHTVLEGLKDKIRLAGVVAFQTIGSLYNRCGVDIGYDVIFIDANGNEITLATVALLSDGSFDQIPSPNPACAVFGFVEGEKVVIRITSGDPSGNDGLLFIPVSIHDARNAICERIPIVNGGRTVIAQPPVGKTWQMPATSSYPCGASILAFNYDSDPHTFNCYVSDDQGNRVLMSNTDSVGANSVGNIFLDTIESHMFPYPYRLEVQPNDGNPIGKLYIATLFAEFDLPKDLG